MSGKALFNISIFAIVVTILGFVLLLGAEQLCLGSVYLFGEPTSYIGVLFRFVIAFIIMVGAVIGFTQLFGWLYSKYS